MTWPANGNTPMPAGGIKPQLQWDRWVGGAIKVTCLQFAHADMSEEQGPLTRQVITRAIIL